MRIQHDDLPSDALLHQYDQHGHYTDCFRIDLPTAVSLAQFIEAFYTTWLFRLERAVLSVALRRRITDTHVTELANGAQTFAAWQVEGRDDAQILLRDVSGRTRSWLHCLAADDSSTRLYFGSAVLAHDGTLSRIVTMTIPLHRAYARGLLRTAVNRLNRSLARDNRT